MVRLFKTIVTTPIGEMMILAGDEALWALEFGSERRHERLDARRRRWFPPHAIEEEGATRITDLTRAWLDDYFADSGPTPAPAPPLAMYGTEFERRVWRALLEIPAGETSTYGAIARQLGVPGASRAVGLANGANPISIIVPCHRVIGSSGALTGYGGGLDRKRWLLAHERSRYSRNLLNAAAL